MNHPERLASYLVSQDRTFYVTTITWVNESVYNFGSNESGIRDMSRHRDGMGDGKHITFDLCQHDIWPLELGHRTVIDMLRRGVEPKQVYWELDKLRREEQ